MRLLGLDFGSKTVGVAVSDELGLTATGLEIVRRTSPNKLRKTLARIEKIIEEYNIEIKDYKNYTQEELEDILEKFQIVHSRYPLGVCIRKDIHLLYHSIYSKCVNTEDQWNQFVSDFENGMYNDQIKIA